MKDAVAVPASDSWTVEAAFDDSCILGVDSDNDPVVEGQDERQVLALMGSVLSHKLSDTTLTLF